MKKTILTIAAAASVAVSSYGQGSINVDNSSSAYGLTINSAANYYAGVYSLQVWSLNNPAYPVANINSLAGSITGAGYDAMVAAGFSLQASFIGVNNAGNDGFIQLGAATLAGINPAGGTAAIALVAWNSNAASWALAAASGPAARGGVVAMIVDTANPGEQPPPTPASINAPWDAAGVDLIMSQIPEPTSMALAGLGIAGLLAFRRRS